MTRTVIPAVALAVLMALSGCAQKPGTAPARATPPASGGYDAS